LPKLHYRWQIKLPAPKYHPSKGYYWSWDNTTVENSHPIDRNTAIAVACHRSGFTPLPQASGGGLKWFAVFACNGASYQRGETTFNEQRLWFLQALTSKQAYAYACTKIGGGCPKLVGTITAKPAVIAITIPA